MKYESIELEKKAAFTIANLMVLAAKTAPKGRGFDSVDSLVIDGKEKDELTAEMRRIANEINADYFGRDANNIDNSYCIVLIGARDMPVGLINCHFCGFENCGEMRNAGGKCAVSITDLGIAIGSAASIAASHRIDNRVMYTAGKAALNLKFFPEDIVTCYGIPLSSSSKSIFFDRGIPRIPPYQDKK